MFEDLTKHCCNLSGRQCLGAFFKLGPEGMMNWIDSRMANKPCLVSQGKYCEWLARVVIPGIPKTDRNLASITRWEQSVNPQTTTDSYTRWCKRCGKKFSADAPNKLYCDVCRKISDRNNRRRANDRQKKTDETQTGKSALVSS